MGHLPPERGIFICLKDLSKLIVNHPLSIMWVLPTYPLCKFRQATCCFFILIKIKIKLQCWKCISKFPSKVLVPQIKLRISPSNWFLLISESERFLPGSLEIIFEAFLQMGALYPISDLYLDLPSYTLNS